MIVGMDLAVSVAFSRDADDVSGVRVSVGRRVGVKVGKRVRTTTPGPDCTNPQARVVSHKQEAATNQSLGR